MKRINIMFFLFVLFLSINVYATSGPIKQDSIIECNGEYYGKHGNPLHWHKVEKKEGKWISISGEVGIPACYVKKVNETEQVKFSKCSDGDTARFIINGEEKKVRFLAIDTPEIDKAEPYSKEASEYTCNVLKKAKEIYLEYDGNSDKEDKYGRILAFIYVDNELLQQKLIEKGYAKVAYIYGDYAHVDELKKSEEQAKNNKIGIWEEVLPDVSSSNEKKEVSEDNTLIKIISLIIELIKKLFDLLLD